jgi:hypothetical protein
LYHIFYSEGIYRGLLLEEIDRELLKKDYLTDAWGNQLVYEIIDINSYRLTCYAADNKPGGKGDNLDFSEEVHLTAKFEKMRLSNK